MRSMLSVQRQVDIHDSETVYFVIQDHHLIVPCIYLFVKLCVCCLFVMLRLSPGRVGLSKLGQNTCSV